MNPSCDPDGQPKLRRAVLDHLAGAAQTYYLMAELANASGARHVARGFLNSAIRITECFRKVGAGDRRLTTDLARAIDQLPESPPRRFDRERLSGSC